MTEPPGLLAAALLSIVIGKLALFYLNSKVKEVKR
jgi:hypothetical protein